MQDHVSAAFRRENVELSSASPPDVVDQAERRWTYVVAFVFAVIVFTGVHWAATGEAFIPVQGATMSGDAELRPGSAGADGSCGCTPSTTRGSRRAWRGTGNSWAIPPRIPRAIRSIAWTSSSAAVLVVDTTQPGLPVASGTWWGRTPMSGAAREVIAVAVKYR